MSSPNDAYEQRLTELIDETATHPIDSKEFLEASKNLRAFADVRTLLPPQPESEPMPVPPRTRWDRMKAGTSAVWDNETTRVFLKAGGAFAGVALVVWSTVHRDHVVDKQAMQQANQRPI